MAAAQLANGDGNIWRHLLGVGLVLTIIGLGGLAYFREEIRRAYEGPAAVTAEDIARIDDDIKLSGLQSPWVSFTATKVVPTKVDVVRTRAGRVTHVQSKFFLVQVGDRWLLAAMDPRFSGNKVVGEIVGSGHPLWNQAWKTVTADTARIHQGKLVPYQLHGYIDYGENWRHGLYFLGGVAGVGVLFLLGGLANFFGWGGTRAKQELPEQAPISTDLSQAFSFPKK